MKRITIKNSQPTVKFGYGDIVVRINGLCEGLRFDKLKEPTEIGIPGKSVDDSVVIASINLDKVEDFITFRSLVKAVREDRLVSFEFQGILFDFSAKHTLSADVVLLQLKRIDNLKYSILNAC